MALPFAGEVNSDQFDENDFCQFVDDQFFTWLLRQVLGTQLIERTLQPRMRNELKRCETRYDLVSICGAGATAVAMLLERA